MPNPEPAGPSLGMEAQRPCGCVVSMRARMRTQKDEHERATVDRKRNPLITAVLTSR